MTGPRQPDAHQPDPQPQSRWSRRSLWSSRSLGSRFQHHIFYCLARWRLLPLARALLRVVVLYYTLLPHVRRRCMPYVRRRFGTRGGFAAFMHAYRLYLTFGEVLLDRTVGTATGHFAIAPELTEARQLLRRVLERGQGCIVITAHAGAWQMGMAALEAARTPVNMLQWRDPQDVDRHYFEGGKGRPVTVIDASRPVEALVQATAALRRGEVLALMGDRVAAETEAHVPTPFMGGLIPLPITAYALASITGAPLVMVLTVRVQGRARPFLAQEIVVPAGLSHRDPQAFLPHARQFAQALEALVEAYPYQFFNFYNIWLDDNDHT